MKSRRTPFAMVPLWVYDHPDVSPTVMQVYLGLSALTIADRFTRPIDELVVRTGYKKSAVYAALRVLERIGAVVDGEVVSGGVVWGRP